MKINKITKKILVDATLPDGNYNGVWGAYKIQLNYNDTEYILETEVGVKGFNISVIVTIKDGIATFEQIKR